MTTTRRRSITQTHERISQLGWEPGYHQPAVKYPTRYTFPKKAKDPMKHIMREYLPMELEKDERVYGGHDAAVRANMPQKADRRWLEIVKPYIVATTYAEVTAGRCMSMLIDAVPNDELRNGYHVQFVDEVRRTGLQMALGRWYAKHTPDPSGWQLGPKALGRSPGTRQALNMLSHFMVGDPIQCAFTLQVVAETAFTNLAFVALPDVAARNGDFTLPTTFLSVQSDEARHISNGYATLLTVLQDDSNAPLIERDLLQAWWINHAYLDSFGSGIMEYASKDRSDPESYLDKWDRWVRDDWYRSYILKLGRLGLNLPTDMFDHARERIHNGMVHKILMGGAAFWMFNFWRSDPLDKRDFEWFETNIPAGLRSTGRSGRRWVSSARIRRASAPSSSRSPSSRFRRAGRVSSAACSPMTCVIGRSTAGRGSTARTSASGSMSPIPAATSGTGISLTATTAGSSPRSCEISDSCAPTARP